MPYSVVINGESSTEHATSAMAMRRFNALKDKPETKWITVVRQVRKDTEVIAYHERTT